MKKIFSFITICSAFISVQAQQTITGTSPIGFSSAMNVASAATASTVPINTTGANVTWNCANLQTSNPTYTLNITSPAGFPFTNDYSASNWHLDVAVAGTVLLNEFWILNNDSLVTLGGHVAGSPYEIYNNPQLNMKFPFSFNDVITDNYGKTSYNANGSISSTQTGTITLSYEGYGTLILPNGTYTNVAMLKRIRTNSIGPTTTSYSWLKYPSGERLMEYDNNGGIKVNYVVSLYTGLNSIEKDPAITVYPSITERTLFIKGLTETAVIKVYNQLGQLIPYTQSSVNSIDLNCAKGIYFVEISNKTGNKKSLHKIVLN